MTHTKFLFFNGMGDGSSTAEVETHAFNMPKMLSSINRKGYHNVDAEGNAQLYTIGMKLYGTKASALTTVAPNTYYVREAVQAWHDARVRMFRRAGVSMKSLGPYGRTLRPYLDVNHENGTTVEIDSEASSALGITPNWVGDEWTYSRAAVSTPAENTLSANAQGRDLVDTYSFTLLDASVTEDATADDPDESGTLTDQDSFVSVGMVAEWIDSIRRRHHDNIGANTIVDADNALLQLLADSPSSEEVLEIVEDGQQEGRPWDGDNSIYSNAVQGSYMQSTSGESSYAVFEAPCGLFNLTLQNDHTAETLRVEFEVLDIRDM